MILLRKTQWERSKTKLTRLLNEGMSTRHLQQYAGHSQVSQTEPKQATRAGVCVPIPNPLGHTAIRSTLPPVEGVRTRDLDRCTTAHLWTADRRRRREYPASGPRRGAVARRRVVSLVGDRLRHPWDAGACGVCRTRAGGDAR